MAWCFSTVAPYHSVCEPPEVVKQAFREVTKGAEVMSAAQLAEFMRTQQNESAITEADARKAMVEFISFSVENSTSRSLRVLGFGSSSPGSSKRGFLREATPETETPPTFTLKAFLKFLLSTIFNSHRADSSDKITGMDRPMSDYFIFASHNTYLTGNQLTSKSSKDPIEKALKSGCRVIELDCWSGSKGKINVLHGRTLTPSVDFEDCVQSIKDYAFKKSKYPVILTIENHLTTAHQQYAATVLKRILGDMIYYPPEKGESPKTFLSPETLKERIIISDKPPGDSIITQVAEDKEFTEKAIRDSVWKRAPKGLRKMVGKGMCMSAVKDRPPRPNRPLADSVSSETVFQHPGDVDSSDSEEGSGSGSARLEKKMQRRQSQFAEERRLLRSKSMSPPGGDESSEISDEANRAIAVPNHREFAELLYIHCQKPSELTPKHERGRPLVAGESAVMANLSESQLDDLVERNPNSLITFSHTNLIRVYPFGIRFNSSNADPMEAWRHGVQVAAINMQGRDRPVWISQALFSRNGGCGYVKKPDILLPGSNFRYLKASTHDNMVDLKPKLELKVRILLGTDWHKHYDFFKKPDYFVKIGVHGMLGDETKHRTPKISRSREPHWEEHEYTFHIRVPELAILRLEVKEYDLCRDDMVGQSCVPVTELREGIRAVELRSRKGEYRKSKLLCHFTKRSL